MRESAAQRQRRWVVTTLVTLGAWMSIGTVLLAISTYRSLPANHLALSRIARLTESLDIYRSDVGSYPTNDQGLQALITEPLDVPNWNGPYVSPSIKDIAALADPWRRPYIYRNPSSRTDHAYDLCTYGPTGTPGGVGLDATICNN